MDSLAHTLSSRLERLNKAKDCATNYEQTFVLASAALTAAKKQQSDASSQYQVICSVQHFCYVNYFA